MTPRPWNVFQLANDPVSYGEDAGRYIITASEGDKEVCGVIYDEADAMLVAAAPELLEACKDIRALLDQEGGFDCICGNSQRCSICCLEAAIAKAEGR